MSGETDPIPEGLVYVRHEVLYVDRERVHMADEKEHVVAAADAGLLELVHRGDSDFERLCQSVARHVPGTTPRRIADELAPVLTDPRSILELRPAPRIEDPDVILCEFSGRARLHPFPGLVERLRRRHRVLHLGLDTTVHGAWPWNASLATAKRAGALESWHDFAQWCRGTILRHENALLVLSGQQDAILFGDLAARVRTLALAEPGWPARVGPGDMLGPDWIPADPYDLVRDLYYALRFAPVEDLDALNRANASSFARLEGFALRNAAAVGYALTDQPAALRALGRGEDGAQLVHATPVRAHRQLQSGVPLSLVLVAGVERGIAPLGPFLHLVRAALAAGVVQRVLVATGEAWFEIRFEAEVVHAVDQGPARPSPAHCVAAVVFPGLVRDCRPALELMARGVPTAIVPSKNPHPIQERMHDSAVLRGTTAHGLVAWLARLADPGDALSAELAAHGRQLARACDVTRLVAELAPARRIPKTQVTS